MAFKQRAIEIMQKVGLISKPPKEVKPSPEPIREETEGNTLKELLETRQLKGYQMVSIFRSSPADCAEIEKLMGMIMVAAYAKKTPLAETELPINNGKTAREYIQEFATLRKNERLTTLFRYDDEKPYALRLGPELISFVKERVKELGVELN